MFKIRNFTLLKLSEGVFGQRLMAKSAKTGDSGKDSCKGGESKEGKSKKKPKTDICGRTLTPTSPRCKNKPGEKSKSSKDECKK
ncbi:uncharacterized protein LOC6544796 [Drosophila erecta]|uniref:Uncharacterized protein n=1 Tax=Drosophila erecta TaxID=7220 RepID=B3NFJ9_DROER|nr:uncharacterized protein LOC6544796 [Drosophila erecta]EDV50541.1 uncharacterized protein Dere_GG15009 [Drosophila erecta]